MKYGPKSALSPSVGEPCILCGVAFEAGIYTTLLRTSVDRKFCDASVEVHYNCAVLLRQPFK